MFYSYGRAVVALAITLSLSTAGPGAVGAATAPDGLSGTWQVRRVCLTGCVSPKPVRKVVARLGADTFVTAGHPSLVLYRVGKRVLVHGAVDSLALDIRIPGRLMRGFGVGANGSTFTTTWVCIAPAGVVASPTAASPTAASPTVVTPTAASPTVVSPTATGPAAVSLMAASLMVAGSTAAGAVAATTVRGQYTQC